MVYWHVLYCFTVCDLKATQMNVPFILIWEHKFYVFERPKCHKHLLCKKWRCSWSQYSNQMVQEILLAWQSGNRDKSVDYQTSLASQGSAWFITFMTSSKVPGAAKLYLKLPKYYKIFHSFEYMFFKPILFWQFSKENLCSFKSIIACIAVLHRNMLSSWQQWLCAKS